MEFLGANRVQGAVGPELSQDEFLRRGYFKSLTHQNEAHRIDGQTVPDEFFLDELAPWHSIDHNPVATGDLPSRRRSNHYYTL